ncbi:polysaccharide deacetylase family protein [Arthrobacter sp. PAMC 25486]|uniref:polysaccharide deacetylase family protein n=1 Tax=Arthrobacter sp. PAMC 25486 TaxID=1494608 RepID=UPI0005363A9A|nr:polysaccharide deacetylase family protein [Arthrobacter sp. PAMC 25486]AIY02028.1 polysaccharide deacetylase family protein [Arthrobacter sp. PAMC 25486]
MPRHLHLTRPRRWIGLLTLALAAALVATGIWWIATIPQPPAQAGGTSASTATFETSTPGRTVPTSTAAAASATTAAGATARPTPAPPSNIPTSAAALDPVTGRVSTLDGLVPDYVLPPVENGLAPVLTKIPTEQKVVFLTIDDGAVKRDADLALLEQNGIKASLFLAHTFIAGEPAFYKKYTQAGHLVENHSMTHNLGFIQLGYEEQKAEICGMADFAEQQYGRRPVFFRPPGGPYTQATRAAVAACGLKAIVDWEAKANAGGMDYQVGAGLRPGDIVLMHFRPEFPADLAAFIAAQEAAGLKVVLLEDYLGAK